LIIKGGFLAWFVILAGGYCYGTINGVHNNYSLIYNELIVKYNETDNNVLYSGNKFGFIFQFENQSFNIF
jgi:hypothetical protein